MGRANSKQSAVTLGGFDSVLGARRGSERDRSDGDDGIFPFAAHLNPEQRKEAWEADGFAVAEQIKEGPRGDIHTLDINRKGTGAWLTMEHVTGLDTVSLGFTGGKPAPPPVPTDPAYCQVHQHNKWCEHNGGVQGATGYEAPTAPEPVSSDDDAADEDDVPPMAYVTMNAREFAQQLELAIGHFAQRTVRGGPSPLLSEKPNMLTIDRVRDNSRDGNYTLTISPLDAPDTSGEPDPNATTASELDGPTLTLSERSLRALAGYLHRARTD